MTTEQRTNQLRTELTLAAARKEEVNEALGNAEKQLARANADTFATMEARRAALSRVAYLANECVCDLEDKLLRLLHSGSERGDLPPMELCF